MRSKFTWAFLLFMIGCVAATTTNQKICAQPKAPGRCKLFRPSYFFDGKSGTCERFVFRGCGGNSNRFRTLRGCQRMCGDSGVQVCRLPKATGLCKAYMPSYYFNKASGMCEKFVYGGCGGNGNRFPTLKSCQKKCGGGDLCSEAMVRGPCRGSFQRFFYNASTKLCEKFIYGGCLGNRNNFSSRRDCRFQCL